MGEMKEMSIIKILSNPLNYTLCFNNSRPVEKIREIYFYYGMDVFEFLYELRYGNFARGQGLYRYRRHFMNNLNKCVKNKKINALTFLAAVQFKADCKHYKQIEDNSSSNLDINGCECFKLLLKFISDSEITAKDRHNVYKVII